MTQVDNLLTDWEDQPDWWRRQQARAAKRRAQQQIREKEILFWIFAYGLEIAAAWTILRDYL